MNRGANIGLAAAVAVAPHCRARAECFGSPPSYVEYLVAPPAGAAEVPTDTLLWTGFFDPGFSGSELDTVLVGPGGHEVALDGPSVLAVPFGGVEVWRPAEPLQPDSDYQVWRCDLSICDFLLTEFRTGAGPSQEPPPVPMYRGPDPSSIDTRGMQYARFDFEGILVVDRVGGDVDGPARSGRAITVSATPDEPVHFARDDRWDCGNWPADAPEASLRFGAYDWSGRFSGWSEPTVIDLGGCSVADPGSLAFVLLCALRRRRPRTPREPCR